MFKKHVPLLHLICGQEGNDLNAGANLATVKFLVEQGADVAVYNKYLQMPADVAWDQCRTPLVSQYLQKRLKEKKRRMEGGREETNRVN